MNLSFDIVILIDLRSQIEETKKKIAEKQRERDYWLEYKNVGSKIHAERISRLEKDIADVKYELERTEGQLTAGVMQVLQGLCILPAGMK